NLLRRSDGKFCAAKFKSGGTVCRRFRRGAKQRAVTALSTPRVLKRHACAFLFVLFLLRTRKGHRLREFAEKKKAPRGVLF
ncbi:MAG: hypothetical protein J5832_05095, partial [Clostridia bacterium]|nr:hypothetical protein [Clostridia bacterium]